MKKIILILAILFISIFSYSQKLNEKKVNKNYKIHYVETKKDSTSYKIKNFQKEINYIDKEIKNLEDRKFYLLTRKKILINKIDILKKSK